MSTLTDELLLEAAELTDPADVPFFMQRLVARLETVLTAGHESTWMPGDFTLSSRIASHGRWLLCDGRELTAAQVVAELGLDAGDADALATLWGVGGDSIYGAAGAGKIKLPDPRDRAILAAGLVRVRGQAGGAERVSLSAAESGLPQHSHSVTQGAHSHGDGSLTTGLGTSAHVHPINVTKQNVEGWSGGGGNQNVVKELGQGNPSPRQTDSEGYAGLHAHDVQGATAGATAPVTVDQKPSQAAAESHSNLQPYLSIGSLFVRV